jgi:lipoate-protein ligase A
MTTASVAAAKSTRLHWLDLRAMGLSILERLSLEEALLRHDDRNWAIVGTHEPWRHRYLHPVNLTLPSHIRNNQPNPDCVVVMGIGGKPEKLLNIPRIQQDEVLVVKRFSGGGTVVLDNHSLWTTLIGRTRDFTNVEPYPRSIMEWSADSIFGPTFENLSALQQQQQNGQKTLVLDTKSCSGTDNPGKVIRLHKESSSLPKFALRENDYVFGDKKLAGNAQSIVKGGWLHHTSFLWDYDAANMEYLTLPEKRPDYRGDRSHDDFLVKLAPHFGRSHGPFFQSLLLACQESYDVEKVTLAQVMEEVVDGKLGGMQEWFDKNRTRIVLDF